MRSFLFITSFFELDVGYTSAFKNPRTETKNLRIAAEIYVKLGG